MKNSSDAVARAEVARAAVRVGTIETTYVRLGRGPVVLVLDERSSEPLVSSLLPFAGRARWILPDRTTIIALGAPGHAGDTPLRHWLSGFLEGIGAYGVGVVAPSFLGGELRRFAESHPGMIARVVLRGVWHGGSFPTDVTVRSVGQDAGWADVALALEADTSDAAAGR